MNMGVTSWLGYTGDEYLSSDNDDFKLYKVLKDLLEI